MKNDSRTIKDKLGNSQRSRKKSVITRMDISEVVEKDVQRGVFFVSAAIANAPVHRQALKAVEAWATGRKAKIILLAMRAHSQAFENSDEPTYDSALNEYAAKSQLVQGYIFNQNLRAVDAQLNPQMLAPLTGMHRFGSGRSQISKTSVIIAHPKQDAAAIPTGNSSLPRMNFCTGAITLPDYRHNRIGLLGHENHVCGGLIVEIRNKEIFHVRQVQFDPDGSFIDCGVKYRAIGEPVQVRGTLILGDSHLGEHDEILGKLVKEQAAALNVKRVIWHDLWSAGSISPYERKSATKMALREYPFRTLPEELDYVREEFAKLRKLVPSDCKHVIVPSNHPEWVNRWIDEGQYAKEPQNLRVGCEMVLDRLDGKHLTQRRIDPDNQCEWPDRGTDIKIGGVQVNTHGDMSYNGMKASGATMEKVHGNVVYGHIHTPGIHGGAYAAGTMSKLRLAYNPGASSWLHANVFLYENGSRQLIINVGAHWRL